MKSFSSVFNHSNICFTIWDLKLRFLCQATYLVLLLLLIVLSLFYLCYTRSFDDVNPFNTWCLLQGYRYSNRPVTLFKYVWLYVCISFTTFSMQNIFSSLTLVCNVSCYLIMLANLHITLLLFKRPSVSYVLQFPWQTFQGCL